MDKYIAVVWLCGMAEKCQNGTGQHRGDSGYRECERCVNGEAEAEKTAPIRIK